MCRAEPGPTVTGLIEKTSGVTNLSDLDGVGEKTAARLTASGISSAEHLLYFLPRAYQDRTNPEPISTLSPGQFATVRGQLLSVSEKGYRRRKLLEVLLNDGTGLLVLKWFRFGKWLKKNIEDRFPPGSQILASGRIDSFGGQLEMHHPDLTPDSGDSGGGVIPVYTVPEGMSQQLMRKVVHSAVKGCMDGVREEIPADILEKYGLPELKESLQNIHDPPPGADVALLNEGASNWHFIDTNFSVRNS